MKDTPIEAFVFWLVVISLVATFKTVGRVMAERDTADLFIWREAHFQISLFAKTFIYMLVAVAGGLFSIIGAWLLLWQTFGWLNEGVWVPMSVIDGIRNIWPSQWLDYPQSWIGIHKILEATPVSLGYLALGVLLLVSGIDLIDND